MATTSRKKTALKKSNVGAKPLCSEEMMDRLVSILRVGSYIEQACAQVGISKVSFYGWMKRGAREKARRIRYEEELMQEAEQDKLRARSRLRYDERKRRKARDLEHDQLFDQEDIYVKFSDAIEKAQAEAENAMLSVVSKSAAGGAVTKRITRTASDGSVITTEAYSQPDWRAAAWRLEKRHPKRWGTNTVDVKLDGEVSVTNTIARQRLVSALARLGAGGESSEVVEPQDSEVIDVQQNTNDQ